MRYCPTLGFFLGYNWDKNGLLWKRLPSIGFLLGKNWVLFLRWVLRFHIALAFVRVFSSGKGRRGYFDS